MSLHTKVHTKYAKLVDELFCCISVRDFEPSIIDIVLPETSDDVQ